MKVCKVVINSVSNDPRVLKEAEAVHDAGFDVVIVGIQDANCDTACEQLENGILVRRVGWRSSAFRPMLWYYIAKCLLALALALVSVHAIYWGIESLPGIIRGMKFDFTWFEITITGIVLAAATVPYIHRQYFEYRRKRKSFLSIRKSEEDNLLKYDGLLDRRESEASSRTASSQEVLKTDSKTAVRKPRRKRRKKTAKQNQTSLINHLPRPLIGGLAKALSPKGFGQWKVIFARESCIYSVLKEERPEIIHAHDLTALPVAAKYAKRFGAKLVFDAHEIYNHLAQADDDMADLNSKLLEKYSARVDRFITINDSIARYYRLHYSALPPATVVKNATRLAPVVEYDGRLHETAGLPRDQKIMIYQGGFAPKRGLIHLLLSAEYLDPQWALVFMGWGKLKDELLLVRDSLLLRNPEIEQKIRFVPKVPQEELPLWTVGASLGAIPYENTGLNHWFCNPNKLWEYPNAGVPIIASPFPELSALIEKHNLGWFLPASLSPSEIAGAVNELTDEQLAEASANCRRFIQKDNWSVYAERVQQMYGGLR